MLPTMLGDFIRFCLHHGLGGLALLVLVAGAVLVAAFAVLTAVMWTAGALAEGFRRGWHKSDDQDSA
jgi:hypothetical protein